MNCHWCGDRHGPDQLCQRAERGMTRRSFCFLFGAGIAGAMLPNVATPYEHYQWVGGPGTPKPVPYTIIRNMGMSPITISYNPFTIAPGQQMKVPNR